MNRAFLVVFVVSVAAAAPTSDDAQAKIINYENTNDGKGNYEFSYETSNGLTRHETGSLANEGQPDEHIVVQGEYSYIDSEGNMQLVQYTADENGYQINVKPEPEIVTVPISLPPAAVASLLG